MKNGTTKPAVVIGTKSGQFFVLDRVTGQPLTKVENQQVKVRIFQVSNTAKCNHVQLKCHRLVIRL
jgi:glucose dehydrogenase